MCYNLLCRLFCAFLCFSLVVDSLAQKKSQTPKERFSEAESFLLYEEYRDALPIYAKLKDEFPDNYMLDYNIGRCYLNISYERKKSVSYLETAVKHMSGTYKKESTWNDKQPPLDALFFLADAYRINNQLEKAITTYEDFKVKASNKNYDIAYVDFHIKTCHRAFELKKTPVLISEVGVGPYINTRFEELNPVVSRNESVMVYASKLQFYQAVFFVKKVGGTWGQPVNIMSELGVDDDCLPTYISDDGTELYLYRSDLFRGDLYVSNYKNGKWTKVRRLNSNINTKYWESHASLTSDGKKMYFTSNRLGGYGGLDIYVSERTSGDNWGTPRNLGPVINSKYNEESPFITGDGKRLFFSSYGHDNMGGYDIFYSDLKPNGSWSEPVNIGYPVNTTDDDEFYCPVGSGNVGYAAKFLPNGNGKMDIVRLNVNLAKPSKQSENKAADLASVNLSPDKLQVINNNRKDSGLYRNDKKGGAVVDNRTLAINSTNPQGAGSQSAVSSGLQDGAASSSSSEAIPVKASDKSDSVKSGEAAKSVSAGDSVFAAKASGKSEGKEQVSAFSKIIHFVAGKAALAISAITLVLIFFLFIIFKRRRRKNDESK